MKVLVVGQGGREHALAWMLARSPRTDRVFVAPGNGGTAGRDDDSPIVNVDIRESDFDALVAFARAERVGLTLVGPEAPLADGLVDAFAAANIRCFGPKAAAAKLEASKAYAKDFMKRHGIPTARFEVFTAHSAALDYLHSVDYDVVIKASGLAAGKGVIVPDDMAAAEKALNEIMLERAFGDAGDEVVIEERLYGQEVSVLAFSDGRRVVAMPPSQDHKAAYEGDKGPNTGGMGAFAPASVLTPELQNTVMQTVLRPTIDALRADGTPYKGVLYAGLMLTEDGPKVLEYNCRFGDPETQAVLPLLGNDLVNLAEACIEGRLDELEFRTRSGAAATVVAASEGYPGSYEKGREITGLEALEGRDDIIVFHAGTKRDDTGRLVTSGGRVLAVTGLGATLREALDRAYDALGHIRFEGMQFRRDIGAKGLAYEE